jgi:Flp pilus assembly pilin Flp
MSKHFKTLWSDENGFVVSTELMIVATILVIGLIVGMAQIRNQLVQELSDVGTAISNFDQSYAYTGVTHASATQTITAGGQFIDVPDTWDSISGASGTGGVQVSTVAPAPEGLD